MSDSKKIGNTANLASRKQERGLVTRSNLLRSARRVFARDGFEHARIEDIAFSAGKTRGAFYANFKSKEDVFCAIFEEDIDRDVASLGPMLSGFKTMNEQIEVLRIYLCRLSKDRQRTLLNLEFKLFAIRHPDKRKRFANLHAAMRIRCSIPQLMSVSCANTAANMKTGFAGSLAMGAILDGLALNHLFDPASLNEAELSGFLDVNLRKALE